MNEMPLTPQEVFAKQKSGAWILDIRPKEAFSKAHIPQSVNVPLSPAFAAWVKKVIPQDKSLIIVSDLFPIQGVFDVLRRNGYMKLEGVLSPFQDWLDAGLPYDQINLISFRNLNHQLIIDVRTDDEWDEGHLPQALHIQIEQFDQYKEQIPKHQEIAVICASGNRASIFASLLKKEGFTKISNVLGGMLQWMESRNSC